MRLICTLLVLIFSFQNISSQSLKGVWRGSFEQKILDPYFGKFTKESYKYEVQLNQLDRGAIEGVTYSYLTTIFYGKASLKGIFDKKNKTITIKETFLVDVKTTGKSDACLMTCYLDYSKHGNIETLIGTYTSINIATKADCGYGTVYLEKVNESDFELEDFLIDKSNSQKSIVKDHVFPRKISPNNANNPKPNTDKLIKDEEPKQILQKSSTKTNNLPKPFNPKVKTEKKDVKSEDINQLITTPEIINKEVTELKEAVKVNSEPKKIQDPNDFVLKARENKLATKVYIDCKDVTIEFYDNGEIDNDTISVYLDNKLIIDNERLSTRPIVLKLKFDDTNTFYELICVAENLGDIPPNTALMVINYGRKRQEVFLTSDDKRNAKVILEYKEK